MHTKVVHRIDCLEKLLAIGVDLENNYGGGIRCGSAVLNISSIAIISACVARELSASREWR